MKYQCSYCGKTFSEGYQRGFVWCSISDDASDDVMSGQGFKTDARPTCYRCASILMLKLRDLVEGVNI